MKNLSWIRPVFAGPSAPQRKDVKAEHETEDSERRHFPHVLLT
jgi:hypothetical protein